MFVRRIITLLILNRLFLSSNYGFASMSSGSALIRTLDLPVASRIVFDEIHGIGVESRDMGAPEGHPLMPFFKKIPLFAGLSADDLVEVQSAIKAVSLSKGSALFNEGDQGDAAYVVESGAVEVRTTVDDGEDIGVAVLRAGEVIGELSLLDGASRNAAILAVEDTKLLRLDRGEFDRLRSIGRPAAFKIIRAIAQIICVRLRDTDEEISRILGHAPLPKDRPTATRDAGLLGRILSWRKS